MLQFISEKEKKFQSDFYFGAQKLQISTQVSFIQLFLMIEDKYSSIGRK
jgi:hypothetical protein